MPDECPARRSSRRAPAVSGAVLAALLGAQAVLLAAPASASSRTGTLRARAAAVAARIAADNVELNSLGETYLSERTILSRASAAAERTALRVRVIERTVAGERNAARAAAAAAYVDSGTSDSVGFFFQAQPDAIAIGETYLGFVEGRLHDAVSALRLDDHRLRVELSLESAQAHHAASALAAATLTRRQVLGELVSEQRLLSSLRGQIAALVAEQLAAARAAAANAAAARAAEASAHGSLNGPPAGTVTVSAFPTGTLAEDFSALRNCESGGNYSDDTGNGYYGAYQFAAATWSGLGYPGLASQAAPPTQDAAAYKLYTRDGWSPWPACAAIIGL